MISILLHLLVGPAWGAMPGLQPDCTAVPAGRLVPTQFAAGRIFAIWRLTGDRSLRLYTDTGGGMISLYPNAVTRIGVPVDTSRWARGGTTGETLVAKIPIKDGDPLFPPVKLRDSTNVTLLVQNDGPAPNDESGLSWDGRLGAFWFLGGVWTFDYPRQQLFFSESEPVEPRDPACWIPIGFQTDSSGRRSNIFPRIAATIDGETIQFLLDSGARTEIRESVHQFIEPSTSRFRAASFIGEKRFREWRVRHPEWSFVQGAEVGADNSDMILVPSVKVGGQEVGPVWFTVRPTRSFPDFMSQYTDLPVEGALGGSAWQRVTLIVDYPRARAAVVRITK